MFGDHTLLIFFFIIAFIYFFYKSLQTEHINTKTVNKIHKMTDTSICTFLIFSYFFFESFIHFGFKTIANDNTLCQFYTKTQKNLLISQTPLIDELTPFHRLEKPWKFNKIY